ncbi:hypothetical protein PILCRDRAFT_15822 [Piloderma croceum F 1598]|uniref:Uncharacterized protein n=1 Tax=Piloderma croceum (strain F 1598) TaxID=765440 RepID=A0A0C3EJF1_PILCF|nr:hypothetical protein PILCRDRAFT_15822 [Piloderma croceum F 1598]
MAEILYDPYAGYNVHQRRSPSDVNADPRSPILHLEDGQDSHKDKLSFRGSNLLTLRVICIWLHILLVLLHLALLIAWTHHFEHGVVVSPSRSTTISTTIIVASQFFISTYTVLLVVTTQRLALYGILLRRQTLTATHDESTAWVGLGSALLVLWKQTHIAASVVGTSLITIYLVGISVLHISTPSLFTLQVFDQPNSTMISTRIGMPKIYQPNSTSDQNPALTWEVITPSLSYLGYVDPSNTIGVQNGTLFDVLGDNNGTGTVAVGATSFNVSCGFVSNATVVGDTGTTWTAKFNAGGIEMGFELGAISKVAFFS